MASQTLHVCVRLYGFNIAVLLGVLTFALRKPVAAFKTRSERRLSFTLSQHAVTIVMLVVLVLYTLLVGASASVVRACFMGALTILAFAFGRQSWALNGLAIAAFGMSILNPYVLWDLGFQLSFIATLGLLLYVPRMESWLKGQLDTRTNPTRAGIILTFFKDAILVTLAAFIVTAPLIALYFHRVSLVGFLTNFLVLPVQPAIMLLGGAATLLQMLANALSALPIIPLLFSALAQGLAWGAYFCLQYTILVVQATAAIPFGSFDTPRIDTPIVVLFYLALFGITALGLKRTAELLLTRVWVPISLLALATIFVYTSALAAPDPRTRITFIGGDINNATFVRTVQDYRILINGTDGPATLLSYIGAQLPPWDRRIDLVILTSLGRENLSATKALIERYDVGHIITPINSYTTRFSENTDWHNMIQTRAIPLTNAAQGTTVQAGDATIEFLYPAPASGENFTALQIQTAGKTILIAPGLGKNSRERILRANALTPADIAVLPNEFDQEWLAPINPSTIILFVGRDPRQHPTADTLTLLQGRTVLRTDERGNITYIVDGNEVTIETQK